MQFRVGTCLKQKIQIVSVFSLEMKTGIQAGVALLHSSCIFLQEHLMPRSSPAPRGLTMPCHSSQTSHRARCALQDSTVRVRAWCLPVETARPAGFARVAHQKRCPYPSVNVLCLYHPFHYFAAFEKWAKWYWSRQLLRLQRPFVPLFPLACYPPPIPHGCYPPPRSPAPRTQCMVVAKCLAFVAKSLVFIFSCSVLPNQKSWTTGQRTHQN